VAKLERASGEAAPRGTFDERLVCDCRAGEREKATKAREQAITVPRDFLIVIGSELETQAIAGEFGILDHRGNINPFLHPTNWRGWSAEDE
jgi:hypothetical protein